MSRRLSIELAGTDTADKRAPLTDAERQHGTAAILRVADGHRPFVESGDLYASTIGCAITADAPSERSGVRVHGSHLNFASSALARLASSALVSPGSYAIALKCL